MGALTSPHMTPANPPAPSPDELRLLHLLASGVTDEVAAARLGWTDRTLRRRLRSAMDKLGATSRLQAGILAERAGWLDDEGGAGSGQALVHPHKGWRRDVSESFYPEHPL